MRHTDRRSLPCSFAKQSICLFCLKGADVEDVAGKLRSQRRATRAGERVSLHHHCAYFASGLAMRDDGSEDRDTICGFHVSDIINEAKRGAKLVSTVKESAEWLKRAKTKTALTAWLNSLTLNFAL